MMKMRMTDKEDEEACARHTQPGDRDEVMIPDRTRAGFSLPVGATSWAERREQEEGETNLTLGMDGWRGRVEENRRKNRKKVFP